jgi:hypothetical protein
LVQTPLQGLRTAPSISRNHDPHLLRASTPA